MDDTEKRARELRELIDQYWSLAYAEGVEGRTHDTEAGEAQRVSLEIDSAIRAIAALTPPEGYVLVPVKSTAAMDDSADGIGGLYACNAGEVWDAMIAARPEVP